MKTNKKAAELIDLLVEDSLVKLAQLKRLLLKDKEKVLTVLNKKELYLKTINCGKNNCYLCWGAGNTLNALGKKYPCPRCHPNYKI